MRFTRGGSPLPIGVATYANEGALKGFSWARRSTLHNSVSHDEPYSFLIENNQINFRPVNISKGRTLCPSTQHASEQVFVHRAMQLAELVGV